MPMMFGFDPTFLLLIPAMIFAFWAQWKVQHTYQQWAKVRASAGITGADMARAIMNRNGVHDVKIEGVGGVLSDHYDPRSKTVRLSEPIGRGASISSIAVAAHEVGHVLQHANGYAPLALRAAMAPVVGIASMAAFPLFMIGLIFNMPGVSTWLMDLGILFFSGTVLFHLVTLPVEFDASKRALVQLTQHGAIAPQEVQGAKKVLDAAALTYLAAAAVSALQLIRLVLLRNSRD
jgi:Zn-dependent membrane protease YugP